MACILFMTNFGKSGSWLGKNTENDFFDQRLEWAAPKRWSKYLTYVHYVRNIEGGQKEVSSVEGTIFKKILCSKNDNIKNLQLSIKIRWYQVLFFLKFSKNGVLTWSKAHFLSLFMLGHKTSNCNNKAIENEISDLVGLRKKLST